MKLFKQLTLGFVLLSSLTLGFGWSTAVYVNAVDPPPDPAVGAGDGAGQAAAGGGAGSGAGTEACKGITEAFGGTCNATGGGAAEQKEVGGIFGKVVGILSWLIGIVCVIMIIIGGFRYVIANGDSNSINGAKNTILYALVGLGIVFFAQVIVQFVIGKLLAS